MAAFTNLYDPILTGICSTAIRSPLRYRMTFQVHGLLITGTLATLAEFATGFEQHFAAIGTESAVIWSQAYSDLPAMLTAELDELSADDSDAADLPNLICLNDVIIEGADGARQMLWWSVNASAVSGWWFFEEPAVGEESLAQLNLE